ncbi:succinyl-CoA synthetase alpha subunit [Scopulibacillus darangshiensis]|uniref:Succinyl-CoA synthetase alpha subunit n=1 Tax=Scopulibacillus darangshiensis TaxID=442528 RepID=A0A4R2NJ08_9BACL|nr:succinate--CoA ligase subunit alpha [Scopulibacillus darangshiensis]TCP21292.1 succinyl-CoA synthetase alpha subunit [Scopulibacillus darangshiensis]
MPIIVKEESKVIIQGITGNVGRAFANRMIQYNTPLVAGVTPGKGGQYIQSIPVYNSVEEAVVLAHADTSFISIPPKFVKQAVLEAIDAGIKVIVIYSEGVPIHDSMEMVHYAKAHQVLLFGPNSAGVVSPGKANVSDIHDTILKQGKVGVVSRSGTLTYEVIEMINKMGLGVSTVVCLGGDPVIGVQHADILQRFEKDPETDTVIYIGEIGGNDEMLSAEIIKQMTKPVFAYIAGMYAPEGKRMGHAGAIIRNSSETAAQKQQILKEAGAVVLDVLVDFPRSYSDKAVINK